MGKDVRQLTKYPLLFKVYWGNFDATKNADDITKEIIENRNKLVETYKIKGQSNAKSGYALMFDEFGNGRKEYDHPEVYSTTDGKIICITSVYNGCLPDEALEVGFKKVGPLYSRGATTFMAVFDNMKEVRKAIKKRNEIKKQKRKELIS
jgi:hypothetical protein